MESNVVFLDSYRFASQRCRADLALSNFQHIGFVASRLIETLKNRGPGANPTPGSFREETTVNNAPAAVDAWGSTAGGAARVQGGIAQRGE